MRMRIIALILFGAGLAIVVYAKYVEPHWIRIEIVPIEISASSQSTKRLRIAHLSDLHFSNDVSLEYLEDAFRQTVNQKPDIICLTGDYISDHLINRKDYSKALRILTRGAPTFACPGNHDGGNWARERGGYPDVKDVEELMTQSGVVFLENEASEIQVNGISVMIGGVGDLWAGRLDSELIKGRMNGSQSDIKVLLSHNPDSKTDLRDIKRDILLCGHTHGGQFSLPIIGTPFAPIRDIKYVYGLHEYDGGRIYVTPGIGNLHGVRFNCRPEISVLDISK